MCVCVHMLTSHDHECLSSDVVHVQLQQSKEFVHAHIGPGREMESYAAH